MEIPRFDVTIAHEGIDLEKALDTGEYDTHLVVILHPDQLAAEQAGPRYGMGTDLRTAALNYTTLWVWFALQRMGVAVTEFPIWKRRVISIDKPTEEATGEISPEDDAVDPTGRGPVIDWP